VKKIKIERIPLAEIRIINPRTRSTKKFEKIVASIGSVGLKRPITVHQRELDADGTRYDLVCGQGRMEACLALGETTIPAEITGTSREEQLLMSLVENLARRPSSNGDLVREIKTLKTRNYTSAEIATKIGHSISYVNSITHLVEHQAGDLVSAVESGRIPISVAVTIAGGNDQEVQRAMSEAYETGDLRGRRFRDAKRLVARRITNQQKTGKLAKVRSRLTAEGLVREYKHRMREQRNLVRKAVYTKDRLLLLTTAVHRLLEDEHFVTLLQAEKLSDIPESLAMQIR
jgi:ParB family transcriptional regulator, chromosome partitioning protein